jgi:drug/metabolite transporter (DMT)-like permease
VLGILVTVFGIALVVSDRQEASNSEMENRHYVQGVLFGLGGATGQALGLVTSKLGLVGDFPALSGNVIRMLSATLVMWVITLLIGKAGSTLQRFFSAGRAQFYVVGGAVVGPFIGVWLSLIAVQYTAVGIASTLMSLAPIFLLPIGRFVFNERVGWKAIGGTMIALIGVAILFLV